MTKSDFLKVTGTSGNIKRELIENVVFNKPQADILFERIKQNQELFSDEECFRELPLNNSISMGSLNFLTCDASYFINVKYLTLAFICLIFDIKISKGFASLLLSLTGIDYTAKKLEGMEKCVAYKIKTEKRISSVECNFISQRTQCGHCKNDNTCDIWTNNNVQTAINSLMSKKIIKMTGDTYEIIF